MLGFDYFVLEPCRSAVCTLELLVVCRSLWSAVGQTRTLSRSAGWLARRLGIFMLSLRWAFWARALHETGCTVGNDDLAKIVPVSGHICELGSRVAPEEG